MTIGDSCWYCWRLGDGRLTQTMSSAGSQIELQKNNRQLQVMVRSALFNARAR